MAPKLYMMGISPPVRSVLLLSKAINLELEHVEVDLTKGEHLKSEYLKLNPLHTIPTLDDNGAIVYDSHAILIYLVEKYAKNSPLYPNDPLDRAIINQRLHFDSGMLFPAALAILRPIVFMGETSVPKEKADKVVEGYKYLEAVLEGHNWIAGDQTTLADFTLITTVSTISILVPIDEGQFPNITAWIKRCETWPYYEENAIGLVKGKEFILSKLGS